MEMPSSAEIARNVPARNASLCRTWGIIFASDESAREHMPECPRWVASGHMSRPVIESTRHFNGATAKAMEGLRRIPVAVAPE